MSVRGSRPTAGAPARPVVAGVDSSTGATKVELRDPDTGALVGAAHVAHAPVTPPRARHDPEMWWRALCTALDDAVQSARRRSGDDRIDVGAIAVAAQQHGMVALDRRGEPLVEVPLWCDTTSAPDAAALAGRLEGGPGAWAEACGSVPVPSFTITKLAQLRREHPDRFERLAAVLLPHDWLTWRLSGRRVTDRGDASGTGYWSPAGERWATELLGLVDGDADWRALLPEVLGPDEPAGVTVGEAAQRWPGAVVGPGTGDNMAAALGLGLRSGDVAISLGTSGTVFTVSERPTHDSTGAVAGFADATGRFLPLVCTLNATKVLDATARLLGVDLAGFDALALASPVGADGVTLLPYFDGERTPDRPAASGVVAGLRSDVSREQLARAAVEGVVCGLLEGVDALGSHAPTDGRTWMVGGGAHSPAARRACATLAGREVRRSGLDEAVATGACVQAAAVLRGSDPASVRAAWDLGDGDVTEPEDVDPDEVAALRARYSALRDSGAGDPTR